ncbi:uncharacterized protein LOC124413625 [Diprion similis]|uniref:uncharacterized protein LOC124413625 n=1 Tax=Diprion similis TaxID=362088 RepID=UPI001EF9025E|nr:uncharacterized protein LOC124413625 [Diprion similis]
MELPIKANMELESPAWLDAPYVQMVLRKAENDESIEVSNISVRPATAKGDNYLSDMYRIAVEFSRVQGDERNQEERPLILKLLPEDEFREQMISKFGYFATELSMMSETLPRMNEILAKFTKTKLSARCLYVQYEKPTHVFIEDLAPAGFRMAVRQEGLDLDHCLLAVRNLGVFHASSVALGEQDPTAVTRYEKGMLHKDHSTAASTAFKACMKHLAVESAKWPELNPRIPEKLVKLSECTYEKGCEAALAREDDFNVLNHGDFWINNMMFRYDEREKPMDYIFVDFQISHRGSPAEDLLYFFATSPSDDIRHHKREQLLKEYHDSLANTMSKLKCKTEVPSFDALQESLIKRAYIEVIASATILPIVLLEKGDNVDLTKLSGIDGEYDNPAYRGKAYRRIMTRILPVFDSIGLLDVYQNCLRDVLKCLLLMYVFKAKNLYPMGVLRDVKLPPLKVMLSSFLIVNSPCQSLEYYTIYYVTRYIREIIRNRQQSLDSIITILSTSWIQDVCCGYINIVERRELSSIYKRSWQCSRSRLIAYNHFAIINFHTLLNYAQAIILNWKKLSLNRFLEVQFSPLQRFVTLLNKKYKSMTMQNVDWLDEGFMQKVLRKAENDESIEVSAINIKAATATGDNYSSDIHRIAVEYSRIQHGLRTQEKTSLLAKVAPQDAVRGDLIAEAGVFDIEQAVMSVTLPEMEKLLSQFSSTLLGARFLYVRNENPTTVIIEDLAPKGFRLANRQAGLDLDHCLFAMRNLAQFHAASIALEEKDPKALAKYNMGLFHKDRKPVMKSFFGISVKSLARAIADCNELNPRIIEKLNKLSDVVYEKACEATVISEDDFYVLNHGDCWVNNMMFKYDERQKPVDQIFVDFQLCHRGSPVDDILYFIGTSPSDEVRQHHRERLLVEYHTSLASTMTKLKCEREALSFDNLQKELKQRAFCEVAASMTVLPIVMLDKGEVLDVGEIMQADGEYDNPSYRGKSYIKIMSRLLPLYDSMGLLDA